MPSEKRKRRRREREVIPGWVNYGFPGWTAQEPQPDMPLNPDQFSSAENSAGGEAL